MLTQARDTRPEAEHVLGRLAEQNALSATPGIRLIVVSGCNGSRSVQAKPHLNQEEQKLLCRYFLSKRRLFDHVARQRVLKSELKFLNEGPVGSTGNPLKM